MDHPPQKSEATPATRNYEFISEARKVINRAGYVFIYPPKEADKIVLPALLSAGKKLKALERKPGDPNRYKDVSKALFKTSKKFKTLALVCSCRGDYEDSIALFDVAADLEKTCMLDLYFSIPL